MMTILFSLFLLVVLWLQIILLKTYKQIPAKELKRQARAGDKLAISMYRVVGLGKVVDIAIWFVIGISAGLLFTILAGHSSFIWAVLIICLLIWFGFGWMPSSYGSLTGRKIASYSAKPFYYVLDLLYPVLSRLERFVSKHLPITIHTGLYEKQDLINLLTQQKGQLDNRITKEELSIAKNALQFSDKFVKDIMTPKKVMKTISATDSIGPILMEELHKSGHSRFPVYHKEKENFIGVLYMRDLTKARAGGLVKNFMIDQIYFVHDESNISEVLQAFIKTHRHLFLVVNSFEEVVGLITMEDVIEQILGKPILDEFDEYGDMRAVASRLATKEHKLQKEPVSIKTKD